MRQISPSVNSPNLPASRGGSLQLPPSLMASVQGSQQHRPRAGIPWLLGDTNSLVLLQRGQGWLCSAEAPTAHFCSDPGCEGQICAGVRVGVWGFSSSSTLLAAAEGLRVAGCPQARAASAPGRAFPCLLFSPLRSDMGITCPF